MRKHLSTSYELQHHVQVGIILSTDAHRIALHYHSHLGAVHTSYNVEATLSPIQATLLLRLVATCIRLVETILYYHVIHDG